MSNETDDRKAAQSALEDAVQGSVRSLGATGVVAQFAIVVYVDGFSEADQDYYMMFSGGLMPDHIARGLFHQGLIMIDSYRNVSDDGE